MQVPGSPQSYSTCLTEMNNYLCLFIRPDSNICLGNGDMIGILVHMVPVAWYQSTMTINFNTMKHTIGSSGVL